MILHLLLLWPAICIGRIYAQILLVLEVAVCDASIVLYQFFSLSTLLSEQWLIADMSAKFNFYYVNYILIMEKIQVKDTFITCILPISNAKRTNPRVAITIATIISPTYVLVRRPCPNELHPPIRKALQS